MDAQSAPTHQKPSLDDADLFPELTNKKKTSEPAGGASVASSRASSLVKAFAGGRKSAPPPPPISLSRPSVSRPAPVEAEVVEATEIEDDVETVDAREVEEDIETVDARELEIDDDVETLDAREMKDDATLIDDADIAEEATPFETAEAAVDEASITPMYDEDIDDNPTVALSSPLSAPVPSLASLSRRPAPRSRPLPVPSTPSARLSPPPSRNLPPPRPPPVSSPAPRSLPSRPPLTGLSALSAPAPYHSSPMASAPAPVSVLPADASGSGRLSSIPPVAESVFPPAPSQPKRWPWLAAAAAVVTMIGAGAAVTGAKALGYGSAQSGAIVVTAAGSGGKAVQGLKLFADGKLTCESSPCRTELGAGTHFIHAEAPGYEPTAARAVSVDPDGEAVLHIELSAKASAAASQSEPVEAKVEEKVAATPKAEAPADKPTEKRTDKAEPATKAAAPAAKSAPAAAAKVETPAPQPAAQATLNINSIPRSNVVLDGRPLGMTPQLGVSVSPGAHTVVFVHPELGRKVAGASVQAGATSTVAVRFE